MTGYEEACARACLGCGAKLPRYDDIGYSDMPARRMHHSRENYLLVPCTAPTEAEYAEQEHQARLHAEQDSAAIESNLDAANQALNAIAAVIGSPYLTAEQHDPNAFVRAIEKEHQLRLAAETGARAVGMEVTTMAVEIANARDEEHRARLVAEAARDANYLIASQRLECLNATAKARDEAVQARLAAEAALAFRDKLLAESQTHVPESVVLVIKQRDEEHQARLAAAENALAWERDARLSMNDAYALAHQKLEAAEHERDEAVRARLAAEARIGRLGEVTGEIQSIMAVYREQSASVRGVDTPGGLEHMGDVWGLLARWDVLIREALAESSPKSVDVENIPPGAYL